jgi:hypothetical protein
MTSDLYGQQEDCNAHEDTLVPWSISVLVGGSSKHKKRIKKEVKRKPQKREFELPCNINSNFHSQIPS